MRATFVIFKKLTKPSPNLVTLLKSLLSTSDKLHLFHLSFNQIETNSISWTQSYDHLTAFM
jgi:hypothetical protein